LDRDLNALNREFSLVRVGGKVLKGVRALGVALTVKDLAEAGYQSYKQHSAKPIVKESLHQAGGWGGAWAGADLGFAAFGAAGIETGPFDLVIALAGGITGGLLGETAVDTILHGGRTVDAPDFHLPPAGFPPGGVPGTLAPKRRPTDPDRYN
jgi:hypothetical protein